MAKRKTDVDTKDRLNAANREWCDRNVNAIRRCHFTQDVAKLGFEAGWRAAFEAMLDQRKTANSTRREDSVTTKQEV